MESPLVSPLKVPRPLRAAAVALRTRRWALPLVAAMVTIGFLLHYGDMLPLLSTASDNSRVSLATRQTVERILFLLPVVYATVVFGGRGGVAALAAAFALLFPRAVLTSPTTDHAVPELAGVTAVGALLVLVITQQRGEVEAEKKTRDNLQDFVRQVLTAQEDERKRIALELHDETAQALLVTCQRLDHLTSGAVGGLPGDAVAELRDVRALTVQTLTDLRRLTQNLRPRILDDHGLVPALEWLADHLLEQNGIQARVEVDSHLPELPPETQLLLFRIAQEAVRNVERHSAATQARVSLRVQSGRLIMTVTDNGRGFRLRGTPADLANRGKLGILGMYERARLLGATLDVSSAPARGTAITLELPLGGARGFPAAGPSQASAAALSPAVGDR